jgi:hypothetical protein
MLKRYNPPVKYEKLWDSWHGSEAMEDTFCLIEARNLVGWAGVDKTAMGLAIEVALHKRGINLMSDEAYREKSHHLLSLKRVYDNIFWGGVFVMTIVVLILLQ